MLNLIVCERACRESDNETWMECGNRVVRECSDLIIEVPQWCPYKLEQVVSNVDQDEDSSG